MSGGGTANLTLFWSILALEGASVKGMSCPQRSWRKAKTSYEWLTSLKNMPPGKWLSLLGQILFQEEYVTDPKSAADQVQGYGNGEARRNPQRQVRPEGGNVQEMLQDDSGELCGKAMDDIYLQGQCTQIREELRGVNVGQEN